MWALDQPVRRSGGDTNLAVPIQEVLKTADMEAPMRSIEPVLALGSFLLLLAICVPWLATPARADGFSNADIDGEYGYSLRGTTVDVLGDPLNFTAIGQLSVQNSVAIRHTRTFNIGGLAMVDGILAGQAEVHPDGRGVAVFCGENTIRPPGFLPFFPRKSLEVFEIVLTGRNSDVILFTNIRFDPLPDDFDIADCPAPSDVPLGVTSGGVLSGTVRRQDVSGDNDD